jgi:hypothetical protein
MQHDYYLATGLADGLDLPAEVQGILPAGGEAQLELAHKICMHAYVHQVGARGAQAACRGNNALHRRPCVAPQANQAAAPSLPAKQVKRLELEARELRETLSQKSAAMKVMERRLGQMETEVQQCQQQVRGPELAGAQAHTPPPPSHPTPHPYRRRSRAWTPSTSWPQKRRRSSTR